MTIALWFLFAQGVIGAFDTVYYHEWRARLPARGREAAPELGLHAARDFLYGVLFCTLPWFEWRGAWVVLLIAVLIGEILLTLWDFVVEIKVRRNLGDVYGGERITHAIMGILYGAMIAYLVPVLVHWWSLPSEFAFGPAAVPALLRYALSIMGIGVIASGVRDLYAALGMPNSGWPWARS